MLTGKSKQEQCIYQKKYNKKREIKRSYKKNTWARRGKPERK